MFKYGRSVPVQLRVVSLDWVNIPLEADRLPRGLPKTPGVYAFQGRHDSHSSSGVLYIGQASVLAERVPGSLCDRLFWKDRGHVGLYSDVWEASLFVAELEPQLLTPVEATLIAAHAPPFNNLGVRGASPALAETGDLLILNGGRKGAILPAVCGGYYVDALWP